MKKIIMILGWCLVALNISAQIFQNGDILVGSGSSQIFIYRGGVHQRTILTSDTQGYITLGMCFSTNKKYLFAANSYGSLSSRITLFTDGSRTDEILGNTGNILGSNFTACSVVADALNNIYVGTSSNNTSYAPGIYKFDLGGNLLSTYRPTSESGIYRSIDLTLDQSTLYYTDGNTIRRFNLGGNTQLSEFITLPDNLQGKSVRLRSDNEVFVVTGGAIYRYNINGQLLKTYPVNFCLLNLPESQRIGHFIDMCFDINSAYFWGAVAPDELLATWSPRIVKLKIDDGSFVTYWDVTNNLYSFKVYGASTAATTQCSDGIDNNGDGNIDCPDDPKCESCVDDTEGICITILNHKACLYYLKVKYYITFMVVALLLVVGSILLYSYRKRRKKNKIR
jgi:hypothetical protein